MKPNAFGKTNLGKGLETLIISSQTSVRLTKIPTAMKYLRGGKQIPLAGPIDFMGGHVPTGQLLVFDAKSSVDSYRLRTDREHLKEHQRLEICRYGEAGFIAGLLCESVAGEMLYWCDWRLLEMPVPSVAWEEMRQIGSTKFAVDWDRVIAASSFMAIEEQPHVA